MSLPTWVYILLLEWGHHFSSLVTNTLQYPAQHLVVILSHLPSGQLGSILNLSPNLEKTPTMLSVKQKRGRGEQIRSRPNGPSVRAGNPRCVGGVSSSWGGRSYGNEVLDIKACINVHSPGDLLHNRYCELHKHSPGDLGILVYYMFYDGLAV